MKLIQITISGSLITKTKSENSNMNQENYCFFCVRVQLGDMTFPPGRYLPILNYNLELFMVKEISIGLTEDEFRNEDLISKHHKSKSFELFFEIGRYLCIGKPCVMPFRYLIQLFNNICAEICLRRNDGLKGKRSK